MTFFKEHWEKGYFDYERDGFGPVLVDENNLILEIMRIISGDIDGIYRLRMVNFFTYRDGKNCQRIYREISRDSSIPSEDDSNVSDVQSIERK